MDAGPADCRPPTEKGPRSGMTGSDRQRKPMGSGAWSTGAVASEPEAGLHRGRACVAQRAFPPPRMMAKSRTRLPDSTDVAGGGESGERGALAPKNCARGQSHRVADIMLWTGVAEGHRPNVRLPIARGNGHRQASGNGMTGDFCPVRLHPDFRTGPLAACYATLVANAAPTRGRRRLPPPLAAGLCLPKTDTHGAVEPNE